MVKDEQVIVAKLHDLVRYGGSSPLEPRTVRMVLGDASWDSTLHEYVLQQVADDLMDKRGHDYDYYIELLEGRRAVEGLVKGLFQKMKKKRLMIGRNIEKRAGIWFLLISLEGECVFMCGEQAPELGSSSWKDWDPWFWFTKELIFISRSLLDGHRSGIQEYQDKISSMFCDVEL